jgi:hypothetical protein
MKKYIFLAFILLFLWACKDAEHQMTPFESHLAHKLDAEQVSVSLLETTNTKDGVQTDHRKYLSVTIQDSKPLNRIKHNERILKRECLELKSFLLDSVEYESQVRFFEIQFDIVETGFLSNETETLVFNLNR